MKQSFGGYGSGQTTARFTMGSPINGISDQPAMGSPIDGLPPLE